MARVAIAWTTTTAVRDQPLSSSGPRKRTVAHGVVLPRFDGLRRSDLMQRSPLLIDVRVMLEWRVVGKQRVREARPRLGSGCAIYARRGSSWSKDLRTGRGSVILQLFQTELSTSECRTIDVPLRASNATRDAAYRPWPPFVSAETSRHRGRLKSVRSMSSEGWSNRSLRSVAREARTGFTRRSFSYGGTLNVKLTCIPYGTTCERCGAQSGP